MTCKELELQYKKIPNSLFDQEHLKKESCICELTLSVNVLDNLDGFVKVSDLNLHWVGPHISFLGGTPEVKRQLVCSLSCLRHTAKQSQ